MNLARPLFPILALIGLFFMLAACARMQAITSQPVSHPQALTIGQQADCSECHQDQQKGTLKPLEAFTHTPAFVKNHRFYAQSNDQLCSSCHKTSFCSDCHTNRVEMKPSLKYGNRPDRDLPHRGDFMTLHKIEGKVDPASCYRCHGRGNNDRCVACHQGARYL